MRKLKAEIWDKVQYIFRNYYDRMVHAALYFDGILNLGYLKKSVYHLVNEYPVLKSTFKSNPFSPYWKVNELTESECVGHVVCDDLQKSVHAALAKEIAVGEKKQFEIILHISGNKCALSVIVNHMCLDGGDLKYFLGKLTEAYNLFSSGKDLSGLELKHGTRSYTQLYKDMSEEDRKKAKKLYVNVSRTGIKNKFSFTDGNDCNTRFNLIKFTKEEFTKMRAKAKTDGATVNDIFLAAYAKCICKYIDGKDSRLAVTNMKNLRYHMADNDSEELTNLTGFMPCVLEMADGSFEEVLKAVCEVTSKAKEDKFCGLYGLPLMALAFRLFPFSIAEFVIKIGYENPLIGMSNTGIITEEITAYDGAKCTDAFITGATKYKPYIQLTSTTFDGVPTLCIAQKCNDEDERRIRALLNDIKTLLLGYIN